MLPTQTLFNRAYTLWLRRPGSVVWDDAVGLVHRSIEQVWAERLPELPGTEHAALAARFREIDRRAHALGRQFHAGRLPGEEGPARLREDFPDLAPERASDAFSNGVRAAAY